jgi:hypothetical protein
LEGGGGERHKKMTRETGEMKKGDGSEGQTKKEVEEF